VARLRAELRRLGKYLDEPPPASRSAAAAGAVEWAYQRGDLEDDLGDD
jgi:hypothetical protein